MSKGKEYSEKDIFEAFFKPTASANKYVCICGAELLQDTRKGYSNAAVHVKRANHENWVDVVQASKSKDAAGIEKFLAYVDSKALNAFRWIEWIVMNNLPLSTVEDELTRKNTNLAPLTVKTFKVYLHKVVKGVETVIGRTLPDQFGLVVDGWSEDTTHYFAVFAVFGAIIDGKEVAKRYLLAMSPLADETQFTAENHVEFIEQQLDLFGKTRLNVLFLCADNTNLCPRIAELLGVRFVGCGAHRLNLACEAVLREQMPLLEKVNLVMKELSSLKQAGKLRQNTLLKPKLIRSSNTRWGAKQDMVIRYFKLAPHINWGDREILKLMLSPEESHTLEGLQPLMKKMASLTKAVQRDDLTMADVRHLFDKAMEDMPGLALKLSRDAAIVKDKDFEQAVVKVQTGQELSLTREEELSLRRFELPNEAEEAEAKGDDEGDYATGILNRKRRRVTRYIPMKFITPTTCEVERLFSIAIRVFTDTRRSLLPLNLEAVLFLKANRSLWDAKLVQDSMRAPEDPAVVVGDDDDDE
jgi:hypothetical protein